MFTSTVIIMIPVMAEGDGTTYINKENVTEYPINVVSNLVGSTSMVLYEYQSHYYITLDTVKELTGLTMSVSTDNGIFSAAVTDGIRTVYINLEDRTISDEMNDKTVRDSSGKEIRSDINAMLYSDKFLVEAVPFLRYLGAEVKYESEIFYCTMNENSIWSVLPDAMKDVDKYLFRFTSHIPDYKKRLAIDIIHDYISAGNLIISDKHIMNKYYKEAINDMFKVNPYSYNSVKEQKKLDTQRLLELGDKLKDISVETAKNLEDFQLTKEIEWLNLKWNGAYKLGFHDEAKKLSHELNTKVIKWHDDTFEGGNIDKVGNSVSAFVYIAKIYSDYCEVNNYDNDTAYCLSAEVNAMKYTYSDTSAIGWLHIADRVSKDVLDKRNYLRDSFLDNTIDLLYDVGNNMITMGVPKKISVLENSATFLTNVLANDIIDAKHREIIVMLQQDIQYQSYNLCDDLWKKAENENFSNPDTVIRFVDALKFFYRFSMAYNNSIKQWGEHYYPDEDWNTPCQITNEEIAIKFYTLLDFAMIPNNNLFNYNVFKDDVFPKCKLTHNNNPNESFDDLYYKFIESELIPEYGLADLIVPETDYNNEPNYSGINGIISAYIKEFDNEKYLITVRFSDSSDIRHLVLDMYNYQNGSVNKVDTYDAEISDYMMGFNVGCIDNYICMNYYNHFNYVSSRYDNNWFVLKINSTGFTKSFSLNYSHGANGYTWIHNSFSEDKTYFLTENGDGNGLDKAIEEIKADLNAICLNSYNISADLDPESFIFEIINTDNISEYSLFDQKAVDYTDLRLQLSSSSSNSTTETTSNIEPETKSSIYAEPQIEVFTAAPWANGLTFVLHMSGVYDYYTYEAYENSMGNVNLCSSNSTNKQTIILTSGSTIASVKVSVTPYSQNGEAGETVEVEANDNNLSYLSPIEFIDKKGTINAQNGVVSGYDETYVIYHGKPNEKIRESLDDGWHITAVAKYESDGITWYKLYDTDDNDYYGWVDSSYINFY